jgi:hypothetical protein
VKTSRLASRPRIVLTSAALLGSALACGALASSCALNPHGEDPSFEDGQTNGITGGPNTGLGPVQPSATASPTTPAASTGSGGVSGAPVTSQPEAASPPAAQTSTTDAASGTSVPVVPPIPNASAPQAPSTTAPTSEPGPDPSDTPEPVAGAGGGSSGGAPGVADTDAGSSPLGVDIDAGELEPVPETGDAGSFAAQNNAAEQADAGAR